MQYLLNYQDMQYLANHLIKLYVFSVNTLRINPLFIVKINRFFKHISLSALQANLIIDAVIVLSFSQLIEEDAQQSFL